MALRTSPTILRTLPVHSQPHRIAHSGGRFGAGWISRVSVITRGRVDGHKVWADETFLQQVAAAIAAAPYGIKSRFTHPTISDDGLGRMIGRVDNPEVVDGQVRADLHFVESARHTPDGDLAGYVLRLAEEAPDGFGLSIAIDRDSDLEAAFREQHLNDDGEFASPDDDNLEHWPHLRLARLRAIDAVDEPAANPNGLFHRSDWGQTVLAYLDWLAGLRDEEPKPLGGIAPQRVRAALARWLRLRRAQLSFTAEKPQMKGDTVSLSDVRRYYEAFGERGIKWLLDSTPFEQCQQLYLAAELEAEREARRAIERERDELRMRLETLSVGVDRPVAYASEQTIAEAHRFNGLSEGLQRYVNAVRLTQDG